MSQTVAERIQIRMSDLKLSQADLLRLTKASRGTISGWVNGANAPSAKHIESLASALKTTSTWLLTGNGLPTISQQIQAKIDGSSQPILTTDLDVNSKIWVPLADVKFSCGEGESIEFHFDETKKLLSFEPDFFSHRGVKPKNVRLLYAKGDSMEMYIADGDIFAIDITDTTIRDGEIYAIYFEGEAMLKQIFKESGGRLTLHSLNKKYKDKEVTEQNGIGFKVIGRQFWRAG